MTHLARRAFLTAAVVLGVAATTAGPAFAHATLTLVAPVPDQSFEVDGYSIVVQATPESNTTVGPVSLTLEQTYPAPARTIAVPDKSVDGSGRAAFPLSFPLNGTYRVRASAAWTHSTLLGVTEHSGTATTSTNTFFIRVPPATPTEVKTAIDPASRVVALTWKANGEADLVGYQVQRDRGAGTPVTVLGTVTKTANPRFVDEATASAGGSYRYQVVAVRKGAVADEGLNSDPSPFTADSSAQVPDPPPPPTTAPPAGPATTAAASSGAGGTPATTAVPANSPGALASSGKVDLSGFNAIQSQARRSAPLPTLPDPGFQSTLPFGPRPEQADEPEEGDVGELAADSPSARELGSEDDSSGRQRSLAFLAAGLLATVLLMHVLWVKSEVDRVPLEAVAPEGPGPGRNRSHPARVAKIRRQRMKPPQATPPRIRPGRVRPPAGGRLRASGRADAGRGQKVSSGV